MFRNYLLNHAFAILKHQKLFSFLNIFGLALGLASAILIFLYVSDELRYDTMQPYYKDTYRVGFTYIDPEWPALMTIRFHRVFSCGTSKIIEAKCYKATRIDYIGYPTSLDYKPD